MKKLIFLAVILQSVFSCYRVSASTPEIRYVEEMPDVRHPQIGYWFVTPETLAGDAYLSQIEEYSRTTPYNLIFLTARNGVDFFDVEKMHPVLERLVHKADSLGIGIGLQVWDWDNKEYTERDCSRTIVETETKLDAAGAAVCTNRASNIRTVKPYRHELFRVYAFKKAGRGEYVPGTLHDITDSCVQTGTPDEFRIEINAGAEFAGYDVYAMSEIYYPCYCVYSGGIGQSFYRLMDAYSDIPFKGFALDEFAHMRVKPDWILKADKEKFTIRHYSLAMKTKYEDVYDRNLDEDLFRMRYSPQNDDTEKIKAVNCYMELMRKGPLESETAIVRYAKKVFGTDIFIGFHNTYHNDFANDEIWATGINWWSLPRDYGFSDEGTATGIQTGIGMSYVQNVMYNMFYNRDMDFFARKALTDLRYGIRTVYHAINDKGVWGVSVEEPEPAAKIAKVERMAALANQFNATYADARILVVAGMEALSNWYPDEANRGVYDINKSLRFQEKSREMWKAGYINALVPSDLIETGKLILNDDNKPMLNGYTFDAVVYLNPQYARPKALRFIADYADAGGKILVEGIPQMDFYANDLTGWWNEISDKVTAVGYSLENVGKLGVAANPYLNGNPCRDNSVVMTDYESLKNDVQTGFSITAGDNLFTGKYQGFVALKTDKDSHLSRFAAGMCSEVYCNGRPLFKLKNPADVLIVRDGDGFNITVVGSKSRNRLTYFPETWQYSDAAENGPVLKDASYPIGCAINSSYLDRDKTYRDMIVREFSSVTLENEMKLPFLLKDGVYDESAGKWNLTFDFSLADRMVNFAKENNLRVHGHTLVWFKKIPECLRKYDGKGREIWVSFLKEYISEVAGHYRGKVASWDVVNEALADDSPNLRGDSNDQTVKNKDLWFDNIGRDYISLAFRFAHEADPDALLFYNDYGTEWLGNKRAAMVSMVKQLISEGVPIDGIGLQMHTDICRKPEELEGRIRNIVRSIESVVDECGLMVHVSEIDVKLCTEKETADYSDAGNLQRRLEAQRKVYKAVAEKLKSCPEKKVFGMTLWGVADTGSYGQRYKTLLFDSGYGKKPAYYGILETF